MNKAFLYVIATAFLFGTMEVALKVGGSSFGALQLTFLRFLIGGLFLLPFALHDLKKRSYRFSAGDWGYLLLLGLVCICISMVLFQVGVMRTNANMAAIIISINPVFTMLFARLILKELFTKRKALVLALSITGLIIVANPLSLLSGNSLNGILITFAAAVTFGLYTALGKLRIARIGGITQNSFSFLLGSAILLIILLIKGEPVISGVVPDQLALVLYLGVFVTGIGYYCYLKAIELAGPSTASIAFFIKPVFAPVLAFLVLQEPITLHMIVGVCFVLAGSVANLWGVKKAEE